MTVSDNPPRVLNVGQCVPDHYAIESVLEEHFDAVVEEADTVDEAFTAVQRGGYDLVLVNRVLDADGDSGLSLIRRLQTDDATRAVPVMLVSNYADAQAEAAALGARAGVRQIDATDTSDARIARVDAESVGQRRSKDASCFQGMGIVGAGLWFSLRVGASTFDHSSMNSHSRMTVSSYAARPFSAVASSASPSTPVSE
jgi:two-component system chemotaxis response regulator CheY